MGSKRIGASVVNMTRLLFALAFISVFHYYRFGSVLPWGTESWRWGVLAVSSILGLVIGDGALFFAFMRIGPRLSMLVMTLVPIIGAMFAWLCFGETILPIEFAGVAITVLAIGWVVSEKRQTRTTAMESDQHQHDDPRYFWIGVGLAFVGVLGQTANLVLTKYALVDDYSELSATLARVLVAVVWLVIWTVMNGSLVETVKKYKDVRALCYVAAGAFVGPFLGIWLSYIAIQKTRIGVAATIMATPPLLLLPLSAFFLKEHVSARAITGTVLAIVGVALLFLT